MEDAMNIKGMYRRETFTDMKSGEILIYSPIDIEGKPDTSRKVVYHAMARLRSANGPMQIEVEIPEVTNLKEACEKFNGVVEKVVSDMLTEMREQERSQRAKIVTPDEVIKPAGGFSFKKGGKI